MGSGRSREPGGRLWSQSESVFADSEVKFANLNGKPVRRCLLARLHHLAGRRQGTTEIVLEAPRFEFHLVGRSVGVVDHHVIAVHLLRGSFGCFLAVLTSAFHLNASTDSCHSDDYLPKWM